MNYKDLEDPPLMEKIIHSMEGMQDRTPPSSVCLLGEKKSIFSTPYPREVSMISQRPQIWSVYHVIIEAIWTF